MSRRTVIDADDSLVIKGSLIIEGNVTQKQITELVNVFESDTLEINADGNANIAALKLTSFSDSAIISYDSNTGNVVFSHPIQGTVIGTAATANAFTSAVTVALNGDATGSNTFIAAGDTTTIPVTLATVNSNVGSFGDANTSVTFTVNGKGLITSASQTAISIPSSQVSNFNAAISSYIVAGNAITEDGGVISVPNTAVIPGAYGSADTLVAFTVDQQGRITLATDTIIDITASQVSDFETAANAFYLRNDVADTFTGTLTASNATGPALIDEAATSNNPTLVPNKVDDDTGIGWISADALGLVTGGGLRFGVYSSQIEAADAAGPAFMNEAASSTNPTLIPNKTETSTGWGWGTAAIYGIISGTPRFTVEASGISATNLSGTNTGDQAAGDGLSGTATLAVDSTVVRTSGTQSVTGTLTLTGANVTVATQANSDNSTNVASTAYVTTKIEDLIGGAPSALDTLREISDSLANNTSLANTLIAQITSANTNIDTNNTSISTLQGITFTAGNGLIGGGNLTANRQFDIVAGDGMTVNTGNITVDSTVIRTSGAQIFTSGNKTFNDSVQLQFGTGGDLQIYHDGNNSFISDQGTGVLRILTNQLELLNAAASENMISAAQDGAVSLFYDGTSRITTTNTGVDVAGTIVSDGALIEGNANITVELIGPSSSSINEGAIYRNGTDYFAYVGGIERLLTAADVGIVEDVGTGGIDIYAGTRIAANVTYHGIRSIADSTYSTISEASNVITINANIAAIRSAFSVTDVSGDGSLSYTAATGVFTYTGPSGSEVRAHFSGTGLISYDSGTGIISTTADNYASWKFTTDSAGNVNVSSADLLSFAGGTGITVSHSGNVITVTNDNTADITGVQSGAGLTGGGNSGNVTLDVGAGDGISVAADAVAVDSTVLRTNAAQILTSGDKTFNDNVLARFGTDNDLTIYHSGSNSFIAEVGTGDLFISGSGVTLRDSSSNRWFVGTAAGAASLFYNNTLAAATSSTGFDVTGVFTNTTGATLASSSGNVGIGIAHGSADGKLHVHTASAGTVTSHADGDDLTVEGSGNTGISILAPDASTSNLHFGSPTDNVGGQLQWSYNTSLFRLASAKVGASLALAGDNFVTNLTLSGASGSEQMVAAGKVLLNTSTSLAEHNARLQVAVGGQNALGLSRYTNSANSPAIVLFKSRSGTIGTNTLVQSGDGLGAINFTGSDGTDGATGAVIEAVIDGTPANNHMPTKLVFQTTPSGTTPVTALTISADGTITTGASNSVAITGGDLTLSEGKVSITNSANETALIVSGAGNDGTGSGATITNSGTGRSLYVSRNVSAATRDMATFAQTSATGGVGSVIHIQQADVGEIALEVSEDGTNPNFTVTSTGDITTSGSINTANASTSTSTVTTTTTTQTVLSTFAHASYGSGRFLIQATSGGERHISEILIVHNGTTASATEYGVIQTSGSLYTVDVDISGANARVLITSASATSTVYKTSWTLIEA